MDFLTNEKLTIVGAAGMSCVMKSLKWVSSYSRHVRFFFNNTYNPGF